MHTAPHANQARTSTQALAALTEEAAAQAMWHYYRDHKPRLIANIGDHRAAILAQLMAGRKAEDVFGPYIKAAAPTSERRRAA